MKARWGRRVALACSTLLLGACGNGGSTTPSDAGARLDAPACSEAVSLKWNRLALVDPGLVVTTSDSGGALTLTASHLPQPICQAPDPVCPPAVIELTQGGLVDDDFDATATFDHFLAGGPGSAAGFRMDLSTSLVDLFIRQGDTPTLEIFVPNMPVVSMPVTATSGVFRIARQSGVVTVTASAGDASIETTFTTPGSGQTNSLARLGLYNRSDAAVNVETSIRFTDFTFNGSAQIASDTFDCNN